MAASFLIRAIHATQSMRRCWRQAIQMHTKDVGIYFEELLLFPSLQLQLLPSHSSNRQSGVSNPLETLSELVSGIFNMAVPKTKVMCTGILYLFTL